MTQEPHQGRIDLEVGLVDRFCKDSRVLGISRGNCPEEGERVYYLLTGAESELDFGLLEEVSRYHQETYSYCQKCLEVRPFPANPDGQKLTPSFLGQLIWQRKK